MFLQPQHPGGQESDTSLDSETSLQKGNSLQMEAQRKNNQKNEERYKAIPHKHSEKTVCVSGVPDQKKKKEKE